MSYVYKNTFPVKIALDGGEFELEFKRMPLNKVLDLEHETRKIEDKRERARANYKNVLDGLVSVTGLEAEDGDPITVEQIKNLDIPLDLALQIIRAFNEASGAGESAEKKPSGAEPREA
jgi:hypothetical protein